VLPHRGGKKGEQMHAEKTEHEGQPCFTATCFHCKLKPVPKEQELREKGMKVFTRALPHTSHRALLPQGSLKLFKARINSSVAIVS
jgi:hypothetical protein